MNKITLRDYQKNVNENIYNAEGRGIKRQLVVMATGAGKSFTITQVILDKVSKGHRVLILVDMEDLVWQWKGYIHTMNPDIRIGIEKADHKAKMTDQIVIATPQTLGREGRKRIKRFKPDHFSMCVIEDRKSTRLNSSHVAISYAVFCLKKKIQTRTRSAPGQTP